VIDEKSNGCYASDKQKKGPVLRVVLHEGELQLPADCSYHFETQFGDSWVVLTGVDGKVCGHVKTAYVKYVAGPQWVFKR